MPYTLTMPKLSPTMQRGTIAKWHKKEGDKVEAGDLLLEVATDKATIEYNALDDGYIRKIMVREGGDAEVNQPIAVLSLTPNEDISNYQVPSPPPQQEAPMKKTPLPPQEERPISQPRIENSPSHPTFTPEPPLSHYEFPFPSGEKEKRIDASPLAKKLAKEKGIDLSTVKGSGPRGRVTSQDLDLGQPDQSVTFGRRQTPLLPPGSFEEIPLSPMRKVVGERLQGSKQSIPHIYVDMVVDAGPLAIAREQLKQGNIKISVNDFVIRATALALRDHPQCNSGFHGAHQSILHFKTIDICVAVAVDGGLITPIVRHADYKNLGEISLEVKELSARARAGKLKPEEYKGGSFTISNLGMVGVRSFAAIINPPQAAILAVGAIEECPVIKEGQVIPGKRMTLTLSADHRVIDGYEAALFLKSIQKYLENPSLLIV